jgi:hydroxypyruvate reductase
MMIDPAAFLRRLFDAAVAAASPDICVPPHLPPAPRGRTVVVGAGKAAAAMARAVEDRWAGPLSGLVVTRYGHSVPTRHIEVIEAGHPMPDEAGTVAARRILEMVQRLTEGDLVLALISGGGSALLSLPAPGIALAETRRCSIAARRSPRSIASASISRRSRAGGWRWRRCRRGWCP